MLGVPVPPARLEYSRRVGSSHSALAQGAEAVANAPSDLTAWLALASALDAADQADKAAEAFEALGLAASDLGQVALAVAAARWLFDADRSESGARVASRIAETHSQDSKRVDRSSRPRPPVPPRGSGPGLTAQVDTLEQALEAVDKALALARDAAAQRTGDTVPPTPLLNGLSAHEVEKLIEVTELMRVERLEHVVEIGEPARSLYWLAAGLVAATRGDVLLGELSAGAFFGEIGLVMGTHRTARVTCMEDCWLLEIPARKIEAIASAEPHLADVLAEYARDRLLANVMRTSEILRRIDERERRSLLSDFETRVHAADDKILTQGVDNERLHVVVSGRCQVIMDGEAIAELTVGDGFGEISLLSRRPAVADVVAVENTVTLSLTREAFDGVVARHPELLAEVYKLLVARERENQAIFHDATDLIL